MKIQLSDHFTYKKLIRFSMSPILMLLFVSIYGIVDGLFVSNFVGKEAFTAINLIMPYTYIFGGFGFMIGTGGCALVGKKLGEKDSATANRYFSMLVKLVAYGGILIALFSILILKPVAIGLGATGSMLKHALIYGFIILLFNPIFMLQNLFQNFLATAERPKLGLYVTIIAGVSNMILDAIFIVGFKMGVMGAALATGLAQAIGAILPLIYFIRPNNSLLQLRRVHLELAPIVKASTNGISEAISNVSGSIVGMLYNFMLLKFGGPDAVAAFGVLLYMQFIFTAIFIGYTIGTAPIISYHYGANNHEEVKSLLRKSIILLAIIGILMSITSAIISGPVSKLFVGYDEALYKMTKHAYLIFALSFVLVGINVFTSSFFTALNNGLASGILSTLRTLVFQVASVLLLGFIFKLEGIWWALILSEMLALIVSISFLTCYKRKYQY